MKANGEENAVVTAYENFSIDADVLSELVEAQLDEIAGGGYSQFSGFHLKTG